MPLIHSTRFARFAPLAAAAHKQTAETEAAAQAQFRGPSDAAPVRPRLSLFQR